VRIELEGVAESLREENGYDAPDFVTAATRIVVTFITGFVTGWLSGEIWKWLRPAA
jgi:hypothetical protein